MSYLITHTKLKKLDNFCIPLVELLKVSNDNELENAQKQLSDFKEEDEIEFFIGSEQMLYGVVEKDYVVVTDLDLSGESSDGYLDVDWIPMFEKSTGRMKMKITWEGGDSTNTITVENGKVSIK